MTFQPASSVSSSSYRPLSSLSAPSPVFPRPVFASDLVAQKKNKAAAQTQTTNTNTTFTTATTPSSTLQPTGLQQTQVQATRHQHQHQRTGHMDLSSRLGDLPGLHLPDFHLPDLQRLKEQLNKHTPSFSLKSLQHALNGPPQNSHTSSATSSPSSSSLSPTTTAIPSDPVKSRFSLTSHLSRSSSSSSKHSSKSNDTGDSKSPKPSAESLKLPPSTLNSTVPLPPSSLSTPPPPEKTPASSAISIPLHPSNYLVKKATATTAASTVDTTNMEPHLTKPQVKSTLSTTSTKSPFGHLFLQIIEARNLTLVNPPMMSRPYCLVEYDQNELLTPPAQPEADSMSRRGGNDIFARAMAASSPKWRHDSEFDVVRPNQQISITIYDSGMEDEQEPAKRFLGQVKLSPSEIHNRMIDSWFRLQGREASEQSRHLSTEDFEILRVLGVGSFGKVYQVRKKDTGRIYAMKVLVKKQVIEQKQVEHTIAERNVLIQALQSPFIVGLKFSFQTPTKLYLVQDFMNGGELFFHMQNEGTFSESRARFYAAELVLALEHLHSRNVIYRDLKPENVLLSSEGHIVLVDFGLCKQNVTDDERTHTFCGTTEYIAPEIVKGTGYGKAVDWWSLGVLLYEMLVGQSPFADSRTEGTHHKILHQPVIFPTTHSAAAGTKQPVLRRTSPQGVQTALLDTKDDGSMISSNAQDIIQRLLDKNPKTRMGSGPNPAEAMAAIKAHPFFHGINFARLQTRDVTPPFQPHVGVMGDLDVSNFDAHFTDQATASLASVKSSGSHGATGVKSNQGALSGGVSSLGLMNAAGSTTTMVDSQAGSFLLQQQQRAANQYRQQQKRADTASLNPNSISSYQQQQRGRRSSNSWSSYRTLSNDSLFSLNEPSSPMQMRSNTGAGVAGPAPPPLPRSMTAYRARALQQQQQQQQLLQQRQQEYFKGFTFEGESMLETIKRQDDEQQAHPTGAVPSFMGSNMMGAMDAQEEDDGSADMLSSRHRLSVDSIFGSM
ncbi:hypothetical protein BGZ99_006378 [Dissophora globulifera]|uniref:non-specific serine/threonine protein kinase n=1 Tax=Dissophora globulifera TaxID=979702 RepID=A0A9P6UZI5_9FUNG|nr:hypothetical protein BGZ99_006378 [Dissophora globulifera]